MPGDARIEALMRHLDAMLDALAEIIAAIEQRQAQLGQGEAHRQIQALMADERKRAETLAATLENEVLGQIIALNNLVGAAGNYFATRSDAR